MMRELRSGRTTFGVKMKTSAKKNAVSDQLSLFGLKATSSMRLQPAGQVMIDLLEIAYPPIELKKVT